MKAYCYRSGQINFTRGKCPDGTLIIADGPAKLLREKVEVLARHSYPLKPGATDSVLLVPGIPEAKDGVEAFDAFKRFSKGVKSRMEVQS